MSKILAKPAVYIGVCILFAAAVCLNLMAGATLPALGTTPSSHFDGLRLAHSPFPPPDPGDQLASGPFPPPDPWDSLQLANGPFPPPDPWDSLQLANGPF